MFQAVQSFHTVDGDGQEVFVPVGKVFPDNHLFVARDETHTLFEKLDLDDGRGASKAAKAKAAG
jgi:hypothetical protein